MRRMILLPLAMLMGCEDTVEDARSIAYEGRSELTGAVEEDRDTPAPTPSLDGRYGASAADCDEANRYMTEYVELAEGSFTYRGETRVIALVREDEIQLRGGERLERARDAIIRWPDQRRKRTVYTRCR